MLYCANCKRLCDADSLKCPNCRKKRLRPPEENDPVYLITRDAITAAIIEDILNQNNIPNLKQGLAGSLIISYVGYSRETCRIFVPYGAYEKSRELLGNFFEE